MSEIIIIQLAQADAFIILKPCNYLIRIWL